MAIPSELVSEQERARAAKGVICPCCSSPATSPLYRVPSIPVHSCILLRSAADALAFPRRDLELTYCQSCGFAFNHIFDEGEMRYSVDFEESQHFSGTFNDFAKNLAREVAQRCSIANKHVLEIGCGKGEFLSELCRVGGASGTGIDPGYRNDMGRTPAGQDVDFIVDEFGPKYSYLEADVILCRHTLEHIAPVAKFIQSIREMIGTRRDTCLVFETPDFKRVMEEGAFWDIYYEHCSYFSAGTHARLFRQEGFDVTGLSLVYDNQYIVQYAIPADTGASVPLPLEQDLDAMHVLASRFASRVMESQEYWRDLIRSAWNDGKRIVLWGGGSKGVSFLTTLGLSEEVAAVVDVNPYKQGRFVPGTGHPVIAPKQLIDEQPDLVVVMNPIYKREIIGGLDELGLAPDVVALEREG